MIKGTPYAIQRASGILIYVSLLSGAGFAALALSKRTAARAGAALLAVLMVWQFAMFYREYQGIYRISSAHVYDPTSFRDAAELIIKSDGERAASSVYIPNNFYDAGAKWRFYTIKHDRLALWRNTKYFADAAMLATAPVDAIALWPQTSATAAPPVGWTTIGLVKTLMGEPTAAVIRRQP